DDRRWLVLDLIALQVVAGRVVGLGACSALGRSAAREGADQQAGDQHDRNAKSRHRQTSSWLGVRARETETETETGAAWASPAATHGSAVARAHVDRGR